VLGECIYKDGASELSCGLRFTTGQLNATCPNEMNLCMQKVTCAQRLDELLNGSSAPVWYREPAELQQLYMCGMLQLRNSKHCSQQDAGESSLHQRM
jgi:hypothetical protein